MDGYAFAGSDLKSDDPVTLRVLGTAYAGHSFSEVIGSGECIAIMTGAVMPANCDTVIPQENVENASDAAITILAGSVKAGDNRRRKGEDLTFKERSESIIQERSESKSRRRVKN